LVKEIIKIKFWWVYQEGSWILLDISINP
jgi:hypothetical protein